MKKRSIAFLLVLALAASLLTMPVGAVDTDNPAEHWFYDQLKGTTYGQSIYNALLDMFTSGTMKNGKGSYELTDKDGVTQKVIADYLGGDPTLFNDFAAAKDAFDLERPEAWYVDSSYLTFRVTQETNGTYHAYIGPGRSDNYYVKGVAGVDDVDTKTTALNSAIKAIVDKATGADAEKVKYVHEQITKSISYRYETDCKNAANVGYIRTAYGLVTHEGVCEAYARSFQMAMNQLGIPCVLIHGVQTSGTPEQHMWNAVQIENEWYVVDATFDDPIGSNTSSTTGLDGGETETYLLVGQDVIGANWKPSGYVSTGEKEFTYPEIAMNSYGTSVLERNGLKVVSADSEMEGTSSTVYHVSFNGDGLVQAAKKGYYFLVKMYDVNADGSINAFDDWYYSVHGLHIVQDQFNSNNDFKNSANQGLGDTDSYMVYNVSNCEYVEFAITTKAPPTWTSSQDLWDIGGYYSGDYSDILAETGLIYNENGGYEQPPYVKNASPGFTMPVYAGTTYSIHIEFTDELYHPDQSSINNVVEGKVNDAQDAMDQDVGLDYRGFTYSWGINGGKEHKFADSTPTPKDVQFTCEAHGTHSDTNKIDSTCRITALDYKFTSSKQWADDSIRHEFYLTGLVGVKSNKYPNTWSYIFHNNYPFTTCPLCSPYKWNMWGQPQALNNPDDLDLEKLMVEGVDGKKQSLKELTESMNLDPYDMNGRLMLVVENLEQDRAAGEALANAIEEKANVPSEAVRKKSLYEIDFARICGKTIVETGQSVRVCLGFPEGIDASMAGIVFKAYHFTRNDDGEIISVEEIPCTVTPYGLVVTCMSFSPFEIVALDADMIGETPSASKTVMILTDEGGGFLFTNGTAASGENGIVTLTEGQHVTLKVQPKEGQALSAVTFDGQTIPVSDDGTVVIAYEDIESASFACILSASFISETVQQQDQEKGMTQAEPDTSTDFSSSVSKRMADDPGVPPDNSKEVEPPEPPEPSEPSETPAPSEPPAPTETPEPSETPAPTETPKPTETPSGNSGSDDDSDDYSPPSVSSPKTSGGSSAVEVTADATTSGTTVNATVSHSNLNQAVNSAVTEAIKKGTAPVVEIGINITSGRANTLNVTLPTASLKTLARAKGSSLVIASDLAGVTLDNTALSALAGQATGSNITLKVAPVTASALNPAQREAVGQAAVVDLSILSNGVAILDYENGTITVSLPYALKSGETARNIVVYYLDGDGTLTPCDTSYAGGKVTFTTTHLSKYVIGTTALAPQKPGPEEPVPQILNPFVDVTARDYYYDAVLWAAAEKITDGIDDTHFSPLGGCTRAQFVTFLWRAAGSPEPSGAGNMFSDVSETGHADYYKAILWAARQGISAGTGDGTTFSPDVVVTRAQSVTFMRRYAQKAGIAAKSGTPNFDDVTNEGALISYYDAIGWAVANGITDGNSDTENTFGPMEACNRAMMITFLYRLFTDAAA